MPMQKPSRLLPDDSHHLMATDCVLPQVALWGKGMVCALKRTSGLNGWISNQKHISLQSVALREGSRGFEEIEKTVFAMHVKPFEFVFNNNVAKIFQLYVNQFPKVQFCLYGHEHKFAVDDLFNDGVLYFQCPCIDKRIYLLFTIKEDGTYDYETVEF